jgi:hypothetical protein
MKYPELELLTTSETGSSIEDADFSNRAPSSKEISDPHLVSRYNRSGDTCSFSSPSSGLKVLAWFDWQPQ